MKRAIVFVTVALVVLPALDTVFARGKGKGGNRAGKSGAEVKAQEKTSNVQAERPAGGNVKKQRLEKKRRERIRARAGKRARQSREQLQRKMRERASEAKEKTEVEGKLAEKKAGREKAKAKSVEQSKGRGRGHKQQATAAAKQLVHEKAKHRRRVARLKRIRELAEQQGNTKMVQRVDKLMQKEKTRYRRKMKRMEQRTERVGQITEKVKGQKADTKKPAKLKAGNVKGSEPTKEK